MTDAQRVFYHEHGYLKLPGALDPIERARVDTATRRLVDDARPGDPDAHFRGGTLARIEYVIDKDPVLRALLVQPEILRAVEALMGPDLLPTWDAMVVKMPGDGVVVPWHRDASTDCVGDRPIFNVDFYLDGASEENGVWAVPGTHLWDAARAAAWIAERRGDTSVDDFRRAPGAIPVTMAPGDVLFHDIRLLHGSPASTTPALRRVVYYEFRTAAVEAERGPHTPEYIPLKQAVLARCLQERADGFALPGETPFVYAPPAPFDRFESDAPTCRYPHGDYWRKR